MKKNKVLEAIEQFPSEFNLDELIEKLIFIEKVEMGLQQAKEGKTIPHDEVKKRIQTWQK